MVSKDLSASAGLNVVGIGEVLWDLLPEGPQLGGAPANFAFHARSLGADSSVITRVGRDSRGAAICTRFSEMGLPVACVQQDESAPTGTVSVTLGADGIPAYVIQEDVAWDYIAESSSALETVRAADAVCFGSLAQRHRVSRQTIQSLLSSASPQAWRIFDANIRQKFFSKELIERSLALANALKLNDQELPVVADMLGLRGGSRDQMRALAERYSLRVVALTRGPHGSLLYRDGAFAQACGSPVKVKDTVGAGDAFTAALCVGLLGDLDLEHISSAANRIAAYVCGCAGAMPVLPDELRQFLTPKQAALEAVSGPHHSFTDMK